MIGTKKLSTTREEIEKALASDGGDPIQKLECLIASAKGKGDRAEVMEDLKRFLESPRKRNRRRQRAGANASPRPSEPSRRGAEPGTQLGAETGTGSGGQGTRTRSDPRPPRLSPAFPSPPARSGRPGPRRRRPAPRAGRRTASGGPGRSDASPGSRSPPRSTWQRTTRPFMIEADLPARREEIHNDRRDVPGKPAC